jgi:hypothetical protein
MAHFFFVHGRPAQAFLKGHGGVGWQLSVPWSSLYKARVQGY